MNSPEDKSQVKPNLNPKKTESIPIESIPIESIPIIIEKINKLILLKNPYT
jgi:hypothetical protein